MQRGEDYCKNNSCLDGFTAPIHAKVIYKTMPMKLVVITEITVVIPHALKGDSTVTMVKSDSTLM